eukprot:1877127-Rhodomonas_salina.1
MKEKKTQNVQNGRFFFPFNGCVIVGWKALFCSGEYCRGALYSLSECIGLQFSSEKKTREKNGTKCAPNVIVNFRVCFWRVSASSYQKQKNIPGKTCTANAKRCLWRLISARFTHAHTDSHLQFSLHHHGLPPHPSRLVAARPLSVPDTA